MTLRRMVLKVQGKRVVGTVKNFSSEQEYENYKRQIKEESGEDESFQVFYKAV